MIFNRRILIVDDNRALHDDFRKILSFRQTPKLKEFEILESALFENPQGLDSTPEKVEYILDFANQGEEALEKAVQAATRGEAYAMIFMDVRMPPGWDGITTISKIWEKLPLTQMIICTAYSDYSLEEVIKKLGVSDRLLILKKPFDSVEVQQMALAFTTKWNLEHESLNYTSKLEAQVAQRTSELEIERAKSINNSKLAALGEMAGGVAHEINNPLAIILTSISIQKELLMEPELDRHMLTKIAGKVETTAIRIAETVKGLRSFSRTADRDPFQTARLKEIIKSALGVFSEKFRLSGVSLKADLDAISNAATFECRSVQIIQVLINLLDNSLDAIKNLETKWIEVAVEEKAQALVISVTDSGPGIALGVQEKLFRPFFTTKDLNKGTGLSLSISKGIIEDHEGTIVLDNQCKNTRFTICLPKHLANSSQEKVA